MSLLLNMFIYGKLTKRNHKSSLEDEKNKFLQRAIGSLKCGQLGGVPSW